jgi:hypothetical protein
MSIMTFIKTTIVITFIIVGSVLLFTPLNGFVPPFFLTWIPESYHFYTLYYIFFVWHIQLTIVILILSTIVSSFLIFGR